MYRVISRALLLLLLLLTACTAPLISTPVANNLQTGTIATLQQSAVSGQLNVAAQTAALRPQYASDLDQAAAWDRYTLYLALDPGQLLVAGQMQLELTNRTPLPYTELYFRLYPNHPFFGGVLDVSAVWVAEHPAAFALEQEATLLRVALTQPLSPGEDLTMQIAFSAISQRDGSGRIFGAYNFESGVWSLASTYPILAQRLGNGWDTRPLSDLGDLPVTQTALYDVTIDVPPEWILVTTGVRTTQQPLDHGPKRERFVSGPQREFYLAALYGLEQASTEIDGIRVVSYYQPNVAAAGQSGLEVAAQSLSIFNARFGDYPLAEFEVIQVALTKFLGMEYPGVVLIEERLYDRPGRTFETTVAHEVGHQWWYSQVGGDQQGEPWLDESLASYMQVMFYEGIGNITARNNELALLREQYLSARRQGNDAIMSGPVTSFGRGNYVAVVYSKGAMFYHALRRKIGEEAFFAFLQDYYATYRYREANSPDILRKAQSACECNLEPFYNAWVNEIVAVDVP